MRNAALSWNGRPLLAERVVIQGWSVTAAAGAAGVVARRKGRSGRAVSRRLELGQTPVCPGVDSSGRRGLVPGVGSTAVE
jgi:hypothetical protein